jgi:hypothetical protein
MSTPPTVTPSRKPVTTPDLPVVPPTAAATTTTTTTVRVTDPPDSPGIVGSWYPYH